MRRADLPDCADTRCVARIPAVSPDGDYDDNDTPHRGRRSYLTVNNIEVIYDHVIPRAQGVSLEVPKGKIVALLGANGAGKSTTLKSISNLLAAERGDVTKGRHRLQGTRVDQMTPNELVKRGVIQVMEGRHCFGHLTLEENLLTGAYTRSISRAELKAGLEMVYHYFPRLKQRRMTQAGYTPVVNSRCARSAGP